MRISMVVLWSLESGTGREFILRFSEEGDWRLDIRGRPWHYEGNAFLVAGIAAGADQSSAVCSLQQFRNIPFYLLTKKQAHYLGESTGTTMKIDNNASGCINDKYIRTRLQLSLFMYLAEGDRAGR
jgi:hypothetical protein